LIHPVIKIISNKSPHLKWIEKSTILLVNSGSRSYGTNIETSDYDRKGICIPPKKYYFSFAHNFEQAELKNPDPDTVIYSLIKFFKLAAAGNVNSTEILFVDPSDIIYVDDLGKKLLANRDLFLSKRLKHSLVGFSVAQIKRMERQVNCNEEINYDKFWKHAYHLVRLLRMCKEVLTTGKLNVKRPDREELLQIRNGSWSFQQIQNFVATQEIVLEELYNNTNILPYTPNYQKLDQLLIEMIEMSLSKYSWYNFKKMFL